MSQPKRVSTGLLTRTAVLPVATVLVLSALVVGLPVGQWTSSVGASCNLSSTAPYLPYAYQVTSASNGGQRGQEYVVAADTCNNDHYYRGQFRRSAGSGCLEIAYQGSAGVHVTNQSCSSTWQSDSTIYDASYTREIYFCTPGPSSPSCWDGPYVDRGF